MVHYYSNINVIHSRLMFLNKEMSEKIMSYCNPTRYLAFEIEIKREEVGCINVLNFALVGECVMKTRLATIGKSLS